MGNPAIQVFLVNQALAVLQDIAVGLDNQVILVKEVQPVHLVFLVIAV